MGLIGKFNGLHGQVRTRKQIEVLISEAYAQEQPAVAKRLEAVLAANPKDRAFTLELSKPAIEVVPASFLECLDCEEDKDDKITGLGKAVSPDEIYQMITDRMIQLIKEANAKDWKKKWDAKAKGTGYLLPFNFASKKMYRGINRVLLTGFDILENPFFLTFKQVEQLKGKVRKGAKGHEVVYFTKLYLYQDTKKKIDISSYDLEKFVAMLAAKGIDTKNPAQHALPILKYYKVFNGKDIEGIDFDLKNFKQGFIESHAPAIEANQMPIADAIIKHYPAPAPKLEIGGDSAHYRPGNDTLAMPHLADFETIQDYYNVYFHELSHSTGHKNRLARKIANKFGSKDYAFEELIAEFGATFLSAEAGIIWHTNKNHAAYLKNWNSALTHLKDDNRFIMRAATQAQKAADFVLQYDAKGDPVYFADLKKTIEAKKTKKAATKKTVNAPTPPSYSRRPKSVSVKTAINDILKTGKYRVSAMQAFVLYTVLKDVEDITADDIQIKTDAFQKASLENMPDKLLWYYDSDDTITLSDRGVHFINSIRARLEALKNQKHNYTMFDGLAAVKTAKKPQGLKAPEMDVPEITPIERVEELPIAETIETIAEPVEEIYVAPAVIPVKSNPLVKSSQELMNMEFESMEFDQGWEDFMQSPARNMKIAIYGKPKNGKTSGACKFANYLTKFGNVLYNFVDQGINKSTQDIWRNSGNEDNPKAFVTDANTLDSLKELAASGDYQFIFIDMINDYINKTKLKPHEFKEQFINAFPEISWILVFEVTKTGNFKGDQGWTHIVDSIVTTEDFVMENRGRYGFGQHVVYEKGLESCNPKRYMELFPAEAEPAQNEVPIQKGQLNFSVV